MRLQTGAAVDVVVPGSAANLGPGFDSMGLALGVWDSYRAVVSDRPGLRIDVGENAQGVPADERHLVADTMYRAWKNLGVVRPDGLDLVCRNTIRMGRGMGSSAAAIVAGVALAMGLARPEAVDAAEGAPVEVLLDAVNNLASALEGHPDNASASVFGGATLSYVDREGHSDDDEDFDRYYDDWVQVPQVETVRLPLHPDIEPVMFLPAEQLATATARAVLPEMVSHEHAALNAARAALLTHALTDDPSLLLPATREWLHQEQRRRSYPQAMALVDALRAQGFAAVVSGAGPSVLVLTTTPQEVHAPAESAGRWQRLSPGIPASGVAVSRATLGASLGERAVAH